LLRSGPADCAETLRTLSLLLANDALSDYVVLDTRYVYLSSFGRIANVQRCCARCRLVGAALDHVIPGALEAPATGADAESGRAASLRHAMALLQSLVATGHGFHIYLRRSAVGPADGMCG
jgi:hypothetical protein